MAEHTPSSQPNDPLQPSPYQPPAHYLEPEFRIQQPRTISLARGWMFDIVDYELLRLGHEPQGGSDDWACYMDESAPSDISSGGFHAHRAATGHEIFRVPLRGDGIIYLVRDFMVEQDPSRCGFADDDVAKQALADLFEKVMGAPPIRFE